MTISINDEKIEQLKIIGIEEENIEKYIIALLDNSLNQFIYLSHGFKFDNLTLNLYNSEDEIVKLSDTEFRILKLLLDNKNKIVTIGTIHAIIWPDKKASIHALRNKIKNLRNKCYYELIQNHSNIGYRIP